jgi:small subunit ribosomal protein S1
MSLGLKQLMPDPWGQINEKYPVGSKHTAKVRSLTNFGVFVELEEGIDGLIHISDLSWSKKIKHPAEFTKVADNIEVIVLEVDSEHRRLSLGHKQLEDNPWDTYETIFKTDSVHEGVIGKVTDKGATVNFPTYGVEGFAHYRHLMKENGSPAKEGESLDFKVLEFSKENKKILVSHSRLFEEAKASEKAGKENERAKDASEATKSVKKIKESQERTTLGDLSVLSALKDEMETSEKKVKADKKAEPSEETGQE